MYTRNLIYALLSTVMIFTLSCSTNMEAASDTNISQETSIATDISKLPVEDLNQGETDGLIFMREEEKLARDVYIVLNEKWNLRVFENISQSEQKHTDAIKLLLDKYQLADPVKNDTIGSFTNDSLRSLYYSLTELGSISLVEALKVGAIIEEIDIRDLHHELDNTVDNEDITMVYENLLRGSENHIRAFTRNLSRQGIEYQPQILAEDMYNTIIASGQSRGRGRR